MRFKTRGLERQAQYTINMCQDQVHAMNMQYQVYCCRNSTYGQYFKWMHVYRGGLHVVSGNPAGIFGEGACMRDMCCCASTRCCLLVIER